MTRTQTIAALGLGVAIGALLSSDKVPEIVGRVFSSGFSLTLDKRDAKLHAYTMQAGGATYRVGEPSRQDTLRLLAALRSSPRETLDQARKQADLAPMLWGIRSIGTYKLEAALLNGHRMVYIVEPQDGRAPGIWLVLFNPKSRRVLEWLTYRQHGELSSDTVHKLVSKLSQVSGA